MAKYPTIDQGVCQAMYVREMIERNVANGMSLWAGLLASMYGIVQKFRMPPLRTARTRRNGNDEEARIRSTTTLVRRLAMALLIREVLILYDAQKRVISGVTRLLRRVDVATEEYKGHIATMTSGRAKTSLAILLSRTLRQALGNSADKARLQHYYRFVVVEERMRRPRTGFFPDQESYHPLEWYNLAARIMGHVTIPLPQRVTYRFEVGHPARARVGRIDDPGSHEDTREAWDHMDFASTEEYSSDSESLRSWSTIESTETTEAYNKNANFPNFPPSTFTVINVNEVSQARVGSGRP